VSRIVAAAPALPEHSYAQAELTEALVPMLTQDAQHAALIRRLHSASGVETRHLVMPIEQYGALDSFRRSNDLFISAGGDLGARAIQDALALAGLRPTDVDFLLFTSVTGIAAPSLDARLVTRLGMRADVKRLPSFGLGCVAGAAGLARVHDYLKGHPNDVALLVSVELCSLTVQRGDESIANLVASGLFGDGAAAVVVVGDDRAEALGLPGPRIVDARGRIYPETEDVIGWDIGGSGFRIILGAGVPAVIERNFAADAVGLLQAHGLDVAGVTTWIAHPGGPKVLEAFAEALGLEHDELAASWRSLAGVGNLSSASVLHVLADTMAARVEPGSVGMLFALGPGVTAELVLLQWPREVSLADAPAAAAGASRGVTG
jgi:Predicted naringenin-chalcone synthase